MGLEKIGTTIGKGIIAWTRTGEKTFLATRPVKVFSSKLKYCQNLNSDIVQISKNNYLSNIKKLALNEEDSKMLENILSGSNLDSSELTEIREMFNHIMNRPDIDLNNLKKLLTGRNVKSVLGRTYYDNPILKDPYKLYIILGRLKTLSPQDAEIIKNCSNEALNCFYAKNSLGEHILPDKFIKKLSKILEKEKLYTNETYSPKLKKQIIKCYNINNKTYFTYDTEKGILEFFEENGIKTVRNINGNETIYKINQNNDKLNEIIKQTICLKDANGKPTEIIQYNKSAIDGIFNVVKKDLKTGKDVPLSEVTIDNTGTKIVKQHLVSPSGTKTDINYKEMPNGSIQYRYKIIDKNNKTLIERTSSISAINNSEFWHNINGKKYNVKFLGSEKIEILNTDTKQLDIIDLKSLLSNMPDKEKSEMILMLKKVPANELLSLNKHKIEHLYCTNIETSFVNPLSQNIIYTMPNEFVFLHEFGHIKDMPTVKFTDISFDSKTKIKGKISNNADFLKVYNKERSAYLNKFGENDERIDYFIREGSGFGCEGEVLAEINALLLTPKSEKALGVRSYLLTENFPETIALASKYLQV